METPFTVYKLIILYMLSHSDTELTNSQLSEFILDRDYTNYFHLQQAISELVEAGLIYKRVKSNSSYYQITSDGASTLSFFESDLSPEIRKDVSEFLKTAGYEVQNSIVTPADYYITSFFDISSQKKAQKTAIIMAVFYVTVKECQFLVTIFHCRALLYADS